MTDSSKVSLGILSVQKNRRLGKHGPTTPGLAVTLDTSRGSRWPTYQKLSSTSKEEAEVTRGKGRGARHPGGTLSWPQLAWLSAGGSPGCGPRPSCTLPSPSLLCLRSPPCRMGMAAFPPAKAEGRLIEWMWVKSRPEVVGERYLELFCFGLYRLAWPAISRNTKTPPPAPSPASVWKCESPGRVLGESVGSGS